LKRTGKAFNALPVDLLSYKLEK